MELKDPRLSIRVDREGAVIEIEDSVSSTMFVRLKVTPENFAAALGRLHGVPCTGQVFSLERIGKRHECKRWSFPMPKIREFCSREDREEIAKKEAARLCPEGWTPDLYFRSQGSFSHGDNTASTYIRRWVDDSETTEETT